MNFLTLKSRFFVLLSTTSFIYFEIGIMPWSISSSRCDSSFQFATRELICYHIILLLFNWIMPAYLSPFLNSSPSDCILLFLSSPPLSSSSPFLRPLSFTFLLLSSFQFFNSSLSFLLSHFFSLISSLSFPSLLTYYFSSDLFLQSITPRNVSPALWGNIDNRPSCTSRTLVSVSS